MSAYLMISLNTKVFGSLSQSQTAPDSNEVHQDFPRHPHWNHQRGWKNTLNNLRLIIQPLILLWLVFPWLTIFPNRYLLLGFHQLVALMNQFHSYFPDG